MNGESAGTAVRLAAVEILCESEKKDIFVNTVLRNRSSGLFFDDSRDRAFLNRLCLGTASARIALDYAVSLYAKRGVDSQRPVVRQILRAGAYEILFMDVPGRATVNSYVEVAGQKGFTGVKSFINAVLRKLSEHKDEIEWPNPETRYSMPGYPASLIRAYVGDDRAEEVYRALLCKDGISVNIYDRDFYSDGIPEGWEQSPLCDHVYEIHGGGDVKKIPGYREGAFAVQDVSSVLAVKALHLTGSEKVLDLCAAPGGKSCLAASMLLKGGSVLSCDVSEGRLKTVTENGSRLKLSNISMETSDATVMNPGLIEAFDCVIADVPCSGLGVSGRKSDIKFRMDRDSLSELLSKQKKILENAARYVKRDGKLLFSTCTLTSEENDGNTLELIRRYGFEKIKERRFIPGEDPCDGFYYCVMRRR